MDPRPWWLWAKQKARSQFERRYPKFMDTKADPPPRLYRPTGGKLALSFGQRKQQEDYPMMEVGSFADAEPAAGFDLNRFVVPHPDIEGERFRAQQAAENARETREVMQMLRAADRRQQTDDATWAKIFARPPRPSNLRGASQPVEAPRYLMTAAQVSEAEKARNALIAAKKLIAQAKRKSIVEAQLKAKQFFGGAGVRKVAAKAKLAARRKKLQWQSVNEINRQKRCAKDFCGCPKPAWYSNAVQPCLGKGKDTRNVVVVHKKPAPKRGVSQYSQTSGIGPSSASYSSSGSASPPHMRPGLRNVMTQDFESSEPSEMSSYSLSEEYREEYDRLPDTWGKDAYYKLLKKYGKENANYIIQDVRQQGTFKEGIAFALKHDYNNVLATHGKR